MFLTGLLWICCTAAMAPALTEAASQAGKFTLPHFPASGNVPLASAVLRPSAFVEKVRPHVVTARKLGVEGLKNGRIDLSNGNPDSLLLPLRRMPEAGLNDSLGNYIVETELGAPANCLKSRKPSPFFRLQRPLAGTKLDVSVVTNRLPLVSESKNGSREIGRRCCLDLLTMNNCDPRTNENMGLVNANLSVDCDPKMCHVSESGGSGLATSNRICCSDGICQHSREEDGEEPMEQGSSEKVSDPLIGLRSMLLQHLNRERRANQLMHRIQRLRVVQSERHVAQQMKAFVSHEQKKLGIPCRIQEREKLECFRAQNRIDAKAELLKTEGVKNLSTAALVSLVRRLESSRTSQLNVLQKNVLPFREEDHGKVHEKNPESTSTVKLDPDESSEIAHVTGMLKSNLWNLQNSLDSDVTESSSGGESCDECDGFEEKDEQPSAPIHKRATWSWAVDRAAVITRWMWLQAQVSDLEYRIRQHSELFRQLRLARGSVLFQDISVQETKTTMASVATTSGRIHTSTVQPTSRELTTSSLQDSLNIEKTSSSKPVNGFIGSNSISLTCHSGSQLLSAGAGLCPELTSSMAGANLLCSNSSLDSLDEGCQAARTRPLRFLRKRKIVRTTDLNTLGRKAAKLSTVGCNCYCQKEALSCTLCGGHYSSVQAVDPYVMPTSERVSLLDPSFHPVLSFPQDVPLTFHFEVHLRREKMGRPNRKSVPSIRKKSRLKASGQYVSVRRTCKLARNAAQTLLSSAKLRRNLNTKKHCNRRQNIRQHGRMPGRSRKQAAVQMAIVLKRNRERRRALSLASSGSSRPSSPILSPGSPEAPGGMVCVQGGGVRSSLLSELTRRKRGESEFDINNIVIPYSIAASTRVERLQYKEILTPKWRYVEETEGDMSSKPNLATSESDKAEDLSDEVFAHRHMKCEIEEKKRFMSYIPSLHHGRSRLRSSRTDGRADSSGANTPDPVSPHSMDVLSQDSFGPSGMNSPMATPPATPCPVVIHSDDSQPSSSPALPSRPERKRSTSFCKRERITEDFRMADEDRVVIPYEPRSFPLTDEEYREITNSSIHLNAPDVILPSLNDKNEEQNITDSSVTEAMPLRREPECDTNEPECSLAPEKQSKLAKRSPFSSCDDNGCEVHGRFSTHAQIQQDGACCFDWKKC